MAAFALLAFGVAIILGVLVSGIFAIILLALGIVLLIPTVLASSRRPGSEGPGHTRAERRRVEQPLPHNRRRPCRTSPRRRPTTLSTLAARRSEDRDRG